MDRFRTKSGFVHVDGEQLRVLRSGLRGALSRGVMGNSRARGFAVYGTIGALLAYQGALLWAQGDAVIAVGVWSFVGWIAVSLWQARDFSTTNEIPRRATTAVRAVRGTAGLTVDRLVVHFDDGGRPARRFLMMPSTLAGGRGELDKACALLQQHGWPVEAP